MRVLPPAVCLQSFLDVVDHGSITAAARARGYSQPAVSEHIRRLEQAMGAQLFDREGPGMPLTPCGRRLLVAAREVCHQWEALEVRLRGCRDGRPA